MHIAGVVVLYYPQLNVIDNILSYLPDLDVLYVIDNSEQCNRQVVEQLKKYSNICYIALGTNCGIAYALNLALRKAKRYNYLLTMDQDSRFLKEELKKYKIEISKNSREDIAIYSVNYMDAKGNYREKLEHEFVNTAITSGAIINVKIANKIGGFDTDLFIDGVDSEYCYKIKSRGYRILKFGNVLMEHHIGNPTEHRFLWRNVVSSNHNAIRRYYITRNNIYLYFRRHYRQNKKILISALLNEPIKILLFENDKWRKIKAIGFGILDAIETNMGKCNRKI